MMFIKTMLYDIKITFNADAIITLMITDNEVQIFFGTSPEDYLSFTCKAPDDATRIYEGILSILGGDNSIFLLPGIGHISRIGVKND